MSEKSRSDLRNIGARFRSARSLVPNLNRKSFCERHGINRYTMQSWENGLHISKGKNIERFIDALTKEGVYCTSEWLIDGKGEPAKPFLGLELKDAENTTKSKSQPNKFQEAIDALTKAHHDLKQELVTCHVKDEAMAPKFAAGDTVFAIPTAKEKAHETFCVIKLGADQFVVRQVFLLKGVFLLIALNQSIPSFTLSADTSVYKIVWHLLTP